MKNIEYPDRKPIESSDRSFPPSGGLSSNGGTFAVLSKISLPLVPLNPLLRRSGSPITVGAIVSARFLKHDGMPD